MLGGMVNSLDQQKLARRGQGGLSARYWAQALDLQDSRMVATYEALSTAAKGSPERSAAFRQLHIDAHFLLIALGHVLKALRISADVLRDDRLVKINEDFEARAPWLKDFRDVLEHLDAYTEGEGWLQRSKVAESERLSKNVSPFIAFDPLGAPCEAVIHLGKHRLPLRAAAGAGSELGRMVADVWDDRFGTEADGLIWGRSQ
jgi:hypothetical protein